MMVAEGVVVALEMTEIVEETVIEIEESIVVVAMEVE